MNTCCITGSDHTRWFNVEFRTPVVSRFKRTDSNVHWLTVFMFSSKSHILPAKLATVFGILTVPTTVALGNSPWNWGLQNTECWKVGFSKSYSSQQQQFTRLKTRATIKEKNFPIIEFTHIVILQIGCAGTTTVRRPVVGHLTPSHEMVSGLGRTGITMNEYKPSYDPFYATIPKFYGSNQEINQISG